MPTVTVLMRAVGPGSPVGGIAFSSILQAEGERRLAATEPPSRQPASRVSGRVR